MHDVKVVCAAALGTLSVLLITVFFLHVNKETEGLLRVSFLDVGQGDAIFIESPSGRQVLIDGGKDGQVLGALEKELGFFDRDLDMVVATHPDADHIGGLIEVLKRYEVAHVLMTANVNDTPVYDAFVRAVEAERASIHYAFAGQAYALGVGEAGTTTLAILFPDYDPRDLESNLSSIVARLSYGEAEYMLTGDSPKEIEEYLVRKDPEILISDVLKVGHHGSRTSTAESFVAAVAPTYAIISAGKDNSYGHPHKEVIDTLNTFGIQQGSTANEGSIVFLSDGRDVWLE